MPHSITTSPPHDITDARTVAATIRETIAHYFAKDSDETVATPVDDHTLRDIGVDRTVYGNQ